MEVEATDTQEVMTMTCRKYGWSADDSTQLLFANKHATDYHQHQQQQLIQDAASGDATSQAEEQRRQTR